MKEIREILARVGELEDGSSAVLATVVALEGSGYRLPGARMLIVPDGHMLGTVSGGCLEADVIERAKRVAASGVPEVFVYDTTADEGSVFSLNMGCRGVIRILLECVRKDSPIVRCLTAASDERGRRAIATLIGAETDAHCTLGGRMTMTPDRAVEIDGLPPFLSELRDLHDPVAELLASSEPSGTVSLEIPQGSFEFALEAIDSCIRLLLFGAGPDAVPMARIASELGWEVSVFDHRDAFLTAERFPSAMALTATGGDRQNGNFDADPRTAAVVMTHNYGRDRDILPHLLRSDAFYVGELGPKRRTEQLIGELAASGINFTEAELSRLFAPIGLDIGGETPESIALSIAAEIQSVLKKRGGGHLRDRKGSIYGRK